MICECGEYFGRTYCLKDFNLDVGNNTIEDILDLALFQQYKVRLPGKFKLIVNGISINPDYYNKMKLYDILNSTSIDIKLLLIISTEDNDYNIFLPTSYFDILKDFLVDKTNYHKYK